MVTRETPIEATTPAEPTNTEGSRPFHIGQILRLSTFQIGSAMADILTAGVWNRILISDFGIPAWPVGLLLAMKYFLAPISIWVGDRSDNLTLWGWHRTSYVWLGRLLLLFSFPLLGASTVMLEQDRGDAFGWLIAVACFALFSIGVVLSGSPYLALVRDSAPHEKRGVAIGIVETVLITLFPIVAILFSRMLVTYSAALFWRLIITVTAVAGVFWLVSVAGVEKVNRPWLVTKSVKEKIDLRTTMRMIWADRRTRLFFLFLFVATFSAWMQDNILEPYGADVFNWEVDRTTRLTTYWGTATVIFLVGSLYIYRRRRPEEQSAISRTGLITMAIGMVGIAASSFAGSSSLFLTALVVFGAGFGLFTFGGLSLMVAMSPDPHSGAYLGLWTVSVLVSKGLGTLVGGVIRDIGLAVGSTVELAYGLIFIVSAIGLVAAGLIITGVDVAGFVRDSVQD